MKKATTKAKKKAPATNNATAKKAPVAKKAAAKKAPVAKKAAAKKAPVAKKAAAKKAPVAKKAAAKKATAKKAAPTGKRVKNPQWKTSPVSASLPAYQVAKLYNLRKKGQTTTSVIRDALDIAFGSAAPPLTIPAPKA